MMPSRWQRQAGHAYRGQRQRLRARTAVLALAMLTVIVAPACGDADEIGQPGASPGADASPTATDEVSYNYMTPTVTRTIAEVQQDVSFPLTVPDPLPAGLVLTRFEAWRAEDVATFDYSFVNGVTVSGLSVWQQRRPFVPGEPYWPNHAQFVATTQTFADVAVTRYDVSWEWCSAETTYTWETDGVVTVIEYVEDGRSREMVAAFIAAMLGGTPDAIADAPASPTPTTPERTRYGEYCNLSAEQATQLAPFRLMVPAALPAPFQIARVHLLHVPDSDEPQTYTPASPTAFAESDLNQSRMSITVNTSQPAATGAILLYQRTMEWYYQGPPPEEPSTTFPVDGIDVTRTTMYAQEPSDDPAQLTMHSIWYRWTVDGMYFILSTRFFVGEGAPIVPADLDRLVTAIIRGSP